ncbi:uncharacterized protein LOC122134958 [Cyprinus carpio]|uniref:Protein shisa-5 n=1 Tax=Cyprinus carpio TaxID=7962 RepID=A0A9Q9VNF5_CYPCA|nr:uncharacterized protein LOC122134958 [Cyprinus carpio]
MLVTSCFYLSNNRNIGIAIGLSVVGVVVFIILFITCCCCPCCCIYRMCRKPRPEVQTHVTTVMNTQSIQMQPVMQEVQYTQYQPVPTQPSYGGQPMQTGPYQEQSNAPGPPPSYDMAMSPGYPTIQGAYDGDQAMYETCSGGSEDNADTDEFISLTASSVPLAWAMPTLTLRSLRQTALALTQHFDLLMCLHFQMWTRLGHAHAEAALSEEDCSHCESMSVT